ncbi:uncharacterized protein TNCV_1559761 [Trichonephila clavipes]|nr:uncharacterized protein TNCV_1559721 [Trichonephila clavipes]GFT65333.1 uncharacterized protein TNCV_1559761 [Trichonephila clavipes]
MDEQLKARLEGINGLKSVQEDMQKSQEETKERMKNMQRSQEKTKNELKEGMQKSLEDMQKGQDRIQKCQEDLKNALEKKIDNVEEKINSVKEKIAWNVEEKIAVVEEKIEKKVEQVEERIRKQVNERIEEVAENFSQRVEDLEKKLLACKKMNENKFVPISAVPLPASHTTNGWNEGVKARQLVAFLRGEAAEVLQTLPDIERLNLNSLYNALDLWFGQKYSKEYARLQMKTRLQKTGESLQEYASEAERLANLAFSDHPATVRETISLQYFVDGLREGEVQKAARMRDVQGLKYALLCALKLEADTQASRQDRQSIQVARVTLDDPFESSWKSDIEKLRDEFQAFKAQRQNQEKRNFKCWGCGGTGHLRTNCPRSSNDENIVSSSKKKN